MLLTEIRKKKSTLTPLEPDTCATVPASAQVCPKKIVRHGTEISLQACTSQS